MVSSFVKVFLAGIILTTTTTAAILKPTTTTTSQTINKKMQLPLPSLLLSSTPLIGAPDNNFSCIPTSPSGHTNPIVLLHGLSANREIDLNQLQHHLASLGYCTFSLTYGAHSLAPWIGGVTSMRDSAVQIADFIKEVHSKTGAERVDLVGHSEGGVMTLYVPLVVPEVAELVGTTVALGPAVHGAKYFGFTDLWYLGGQMTRDLVAKALGWIGCRACDDMAVDGDVYRDFLHAAENGGIVRRDKEVKASVVMSRADTLVKPEDSIVLEQGVRNLFVQDWCPEDEVGHAGLAWDKGVWDIVVNELRGDYEGAVGCDQGLPF